MLSLTTTASMTLVNIAEIFLCANFETSVHRMTHKDTEDSRGKANKN